MMANRWWKKAGPSKGADTGHRGPDAKDAPIKTAAWPGLPGKTQSKDRSAGVKKIKQSMKSEGI